MMQFIKRGKDLNLLAMTDMEAMKLSNILSQYAELTEKSTGKGDHARRSLARQIDDVIKKGMP